MDLHVRVWYGNVGSPKEFSKEQTVILLFDPEEPAPAYPLAWGSRHTAQGSLEPWDYATEICPEYMTVKVTYGWPLGAQAYSMYPWIYQNYVPSLRPEGLRRAWSRVDHLPRRCCRNHSGRILLRCLSQGSRASSSNPGLCATTPSGLTA